MRTTNMPTPWLIDFQTGTMHDMAQVMRDRVPKIFVVAVAPQLPEVLMRMASMPMDGVMIVPAHRNTSALSRSMIAITSA